MTVTQLLANSTARELAEWHAYFNYIENETERRRVREMTKNFVSGLDAFLEKQQGES